METCMMHGNDWLLELPMGGMDEFVEEESQAAAAAGAIGIETVSHEYIDDLLKQVEDIKKAYRDQRAEGPRRPLPTRRVKDIMEAYENQPGKQAESLCLWIRSATLRMKMDEEDHRLGLGQHIMMQ